MARRQRSCCSRTRSQPWKLIKQPVRAPRVRHNRRLLAVDLSCTGSWWVRENSWYWRRRLMTIAVQWSRSKDPDAPQLLRKTIAAWPPIIWFSIRTRIAKRGRNSNKSNSTRSENTEPWNRRRGCTGKSGKASTASRTSSWMISSPNSSYHTLASRFTSPSLSYLSRPSTMPDR